MFCNELSLQDIQDIKDACGCSGTSTTSDDNFSYDLIDKQITVPYNQQMAIYEELIVEDELILDGRIYLNE